MNGDDPAGLAAQLKEAAAKIADQATIIDTLTRSLRTSQDMLGGIHRDSESPGASCTVSKSSLPQALMSKPPCYSALASDLPARQWLNVMNSFAELSHVATNCRVALYATYLRGQAASWYWRFPSAVRASMTCVDIEHELTLCFGQFEVDREFTAREGLAVIKQRGRRVQEYITEFMHLCHDVTDLSDGDKSAYFRRGLDSDLRAHALFRPGGAEKFANFKEVMNFVVTKAQIIESLRIHRGPTAAAPAPAGLNPKRRREARLDPVRVVFPRAVNTHHVHQQGGRLPRPPRLMLTQERAPGPSRSICPREAERRVRDGACKLCGQRGHMPRACVNAMVGPFVQRSTRASS